MQAYKNLILTRRTHRRRSNIFNQEGMYTYSASYPIKNNTSYELLTLLKIKNHQVFMLV